MSLTIRQANPPALTAAHEVENPVTPLLAVGSMLTETPLRTSIREFLFEVTKDGSIFWVGAAVPEGTTDFTRTQVYFHPTVVQAGVVHAADTDYRIFTGGWSGSIQRYVAMEGGQLAGARLMPLLVPFTTMGALSNPALNMFSNRPVEMLNSIMAAIQSEIIPGRGAPSLTKVGVSSFSSGIGALKLFMNAMSSSGLVKEVIDFDSSFISGSPRRLTRWPGAVSKCYTQVSPDLPETWWVHLPAGMFAGIRSFPNPSPNQHAHACIGWMTYWAAMMASEIP